LRLDLNSNGCVEKRFCTTFRYCIGILSVTQLCVKGKLSLAVNRGHESSPIRIECEIHPGGSVSNSLVEAWGAEIHGIHRTAQEISDGSALAFVVEPQLVPNETAGAIRANQILRKNCEARRAFYVFNHGTDGMGSLAEVKKPVPKSHCDCWKSFGLLTQNSFNELLRNTMWQFRSAPRAS
jgi:hypothetical protein